MWGGLVPDAVITLSRLIASLHDDDGNLLVEGLVSGPAADVDYPEERLRAESGVGPGVEWIGSGPKVERLWTQPALSVIGLDAPKVDGSSNTLIPAARARLALRTAPGETSKNAIACLSEHLEKHVPWGAQLTIDVVDTGEPIALDVTGPAYDAARGAFTEAWGGTEPVDMGVGGSIPFIAEFLDAMPDASVLVTGVEDPDTRAHGANEGLHLAEFEKVLRRGSPACSATWAPKPPPASCSRRRSSIAQRRRRVRRDARTRPPTRRRRHVTAARTTATRPSRRLSTHVAPKRD